MGKVIEKTKIIRDRTKLYYCGTDENGFITICEAQLKRRKKEDKKNA